MLGSGVGMIEKDSKLKNPIFMNLTLHYSWVHVVVEKLLLTLKLRPSTGLQGSYTATVMAHQMAGTDTILHLCLGNIRNVFMTT